MTATLLAAGWSEDFQAASDRSVTPEARRARRGRKLDRQDRQVTPSVSVDEAYEESLASLGRAAEEASRRDWDGHGGYPVSDATLEQALAFLDLLPTGLPQPDIAPHPDGEIAFEWWVAPRRLVTVSVSESGRLSYAALFGSARQYGTELLLDPLPVPVAAALRRLYATG